RNNLNKKVGGDYMECLWCESEDILLSKENAYWELPAGNRAIEFSKIPSVECKSCGMIYQNDSIIEAIEEQLLLIDNNKLESNISYESVMDEPRLLKKKYL